LPDKKIYFMSYAVIQSGGKQYKVKSGEILKIEKLPNSKSDTKIKIELYLFLKREEDKTQEEKMVIDKNIL